MDRRTDQQPAGAGSKAWKPWKKPELRRVKLTDGEAAALRQSDNPQGLLRRMWPEVRDRDQN